MNSSSASRNNILTRLQQTTGVVQKDSGNFTFHEGSSFDEGKRWSAEEKVLRLKSMMEAVHTEVHLCVENTWIKNLCSILEQKQINKILYGAKTGLAQEIGNLKQESTEMMPELIDYKDPIEESKDLLFEIDAAITTTRGGIAETGSLILWPTPDEPRLMSLVPPVHIAVLYASEIYSTFREAMISENWSSEMPTNALLISGPSKTADIEQTLVYGIHGCKELVVLVIQ